MWHFLVDGVLSCEGSVRGESHCSTSNPLSRKVFSVAVRLRSLRRAGRHRHEVETIWNEQPRRFEGACLGPKEQAVVEGGDYDQQYTVSTATQNMTPWALQATGWLRGIYLLVTGTGVTVGTVTADGPFSIFYNS